MTFSIPTEEWKEAQKGITNVKTPEIIKIDVDPNIQAYPPIRKEWGGGYARKTEGGKTILVSQKQAYKSSEFLGAGAATNNVTIEEGRVFIVHNISIQVRLSPAASIALSIYGSTGATGDVKFRFVYGANVGFYSWGLHTPLIFENDFSVNLSLRNAATDVQVLLLGYYEDK